MNRLEAPILQCTRLEASKHGCRLFRNNRGLFYTKDGRRVKAGLDAEGSSDLIGFVPVTITPDMVGKQVAVFLAVETKREGWEKPKGETELRQANFINFVNNFGGIGFFLNDPDDLKKSIDELKP